MTTSRLALVVANVLGIVAGISGGYLMRRSKATTHVGRLYRVGDMTFVDGAFVDYLRAHLESYVDHEWTVFRLKDRGLFLRKEYDEGMLPGQKGPLYLLRTISTASLAGENDKEVAVVVQAMIEVDILDFGGRWRSWRDVNAKTTNETDRRALADRD